MTETGMKLASTELVGSSTEATAPPHRPQVSAEPVADARRNMVKSSVYRALVQMIGFALPWSLRRWLLCKVLGFSIHRTARIGLSIVLADEVRIDKGALLGHLNYIGRLDRFIMGEGCVVARYNWITGLARSVETPFFRSKSNRRSDLIMGKGALITTWHLIDCTDAVEFADYASLAGARTQILTHGVDILRNRQACGRVYLGAYTVVSTGSIILKNVTIAERCLVGAGSVVVASVNEPYTWVAGNPATFVRKIPEHSKLFHRTDPTVY